MSNFTANTLTTGVNLSSGFTYDVLTGTYSNTAFNNIPLTHNTSNFATLGASTTFAIPDADTKPKVSINEKGIKMDADCDILVGNTSLKQFMQSIESRLAILIPDPRLETEWQELKELGDQYRLLQNQIQEKMRTWNILQRKANDDCDNNII